jgi:hypothetical protein
MWVMRSPGGPGGLTGSRLGEGDGKTGNIDPGPAG